MLNISFEEAVLFFGCGIVIGVESVGFDCIVVIVAPFCEVIREFKAWHIC